MSNTRIAEKATKTSFSVFMRLLHILALVQHGVESENMNCRTMADLLSFEPGNEKVTDKMIRDSIPKLKEMGLPVEMATGGLRAWLERELTAEEMLDLLPYYLNVVTDTVGIRDCFKSYVDTHKSRSLWIIARIYFASLEKKQIELVYRSMKNTGPAKYRLNPYRWIYRDNAVYLVARNIKRDDKNISLFRLNRISELKVLPKTFDDVVPSSEELLRYSVGAFMSNDLHEVNLRLKAGLREYIEEDFGHLDIEFSDTENEGFIDARFTACDIINVCKAVFSYSGDVKITGDDFTVREMKRLLEENLKVLKD